MKHNVPYNTGKVRIGHAYIPQRNHMTDSDAVFWQGVLLGEHGRDRRQTLAVVAATIAAAVALYACSVFI